MGGLSTAPHTPHRTYPQVSTTYPQGYPQFGATYPHPLWTTIADLWISRCSTWNIHRLSTGLSTDRGAEYSYPQAVDKGRLLQSGYKVHIPLDKGRIPSGPFKCVLTALPPSGPPVGGHPPVRRFWGNLTA